LLNNGWQNQGRAHTKRHRIDANNRRWPFKLGYESDEISIFDSTGLAVQDIICAKLVYEKEKGTDMVNVFSFM